MKEKMQHYLLVLCIVFMTVGAISLFLNNVSFNPNFSMIDAITGATTKTHHPNDENDSISEWNYSKDDIALADTAYTEEVIKVGESTYWVLRKDSDTDNIVILSNKEDSTYQRAVNRIAGYFESQGYHVQIKECSETMMLSLAHAGHFDVFLMNEEVKQ